MRPSLVTKTSRRIVMNKAFLTIIGVLAFSSHALAADVANGKTLFAQRCAMCHGEKGAGDGALAATMPEGQKPRNLAAGGNKYATDDAKLKEIIQKGGAAVGLSVLMPAQSDLNDAQLGDLVAFVNSLKAK
jgi:mono/diheme cytochrome c family protein